MNEDLRVGVSSISEVIIGQWVDRLMKSGFYTFCGDLCRRKDFCIDILCVYNF